MHGAGRFQVAAIEIGKRMDLWVIKIDPDPNAPGLKLADYAYTVDLAEFEKCMSIAKDHRIEEALTIGADFPIQTIAKMREALNLCGLNSPAAKAATSKKEMRRLLALAGIPCPRSIPVCDYRCSSTSTQHVDGRYYL